LLQVDYFTKHKYPVLRALLPLRKKGEPKVQKNKITMFTLKLQATKNTGVRLSLEKKNFKAKTQLTELF